MFFEFNIFEYLAPRINIVRCHEVTTIIRRDIDHFDFDNDRYDDARRT